MALTRRSGGGDQAPVYAERLQGLLVSADRGNMTDAVTEALREAILDGSISPTEWLREDELATTLRVSRTPIREALRRLSDEGLTHRVANRGTVVTTVTIDEVLAVYEVRESLEGLAARTVASRRPRSLVEELNRIYGVMEEHVDGDERVNAELSFDFHRAIREATGNPYLVRFLTHAEQVIRRFGQTTFAQSARSHEALAEHRALIDAIASADADLAERLATEHMRRSRESHVRELLR